MLKTENIRGGKETKDYLADTEERMANEDLARRNNLMLDTKQFNKYCEENKLDKTQRHSFENYLNNGSSHYQARYIGHTEEVFGVSKYNKAVYHNLMDGKLPITAEQFQKLNPNVKIHNLETGEITKPVENKKTGIDFVANFPKSLSAHFALADNNTRNRIHEAGVRAFDKSVKEMAKQLKPSTQRKEYMDFDPEATKIFVTSYFHPDARPDEKNKSKLDKEQVLDTVMSHGHFHGHCSNFAMFGFYVRDKEGNKVLDENGKPKLEYQMLAVDQQELFKSQLLNSATFDTMLNSEINKIGIETEKHLIVNPDTGVYHETFKVVGYDREDEEKTSLRSQSILEQAKKQNKTSKDTDYLKQVGKNTRGSKIELSPEELKESIKKNTLEALGEDKLEKVMKAQAQAKAMRMREEQSILLTNSKQAEIDRECFSKITNNHKLDTTGYMTDREIRAELTRSLMTSRTFKDMKDLNTEIDKKINDMSQVERGVNRLVKIKGGYTRLSNRLNEEGFRQNAIKLMNKGRPRTDKELQTDKQIFNDFIQMKKNEGMIINEGQEKAIFKNMKLGTETNISLDVGDAGSGKSSTVLAGMKYVWDKKYGEGKVIGISVGQSATKELKSIGIPEKQLLNSTNFVMKAVIKKPDGTYELNPKFINDKKNHGNLYIFDEFGMEGSSKAYLITEIAKATNSSILCVGDHKQLQSPSYGNPFTVLKDELINQDPNNVGRLDEVMRHKNDIGKKIAFAYRDKDTETLFNTLKENDCLVTGKNEKAVMKSIAEDFMKMEVPVNQRIIVSKKNKTNDLLNDKLREEIKKAEDTGIDFSKEYKIAVSRPTAQADIVREREFAVGERIVFLKNAKELENGKPKKDGWQVENNQLATITDIKALKNGTYDMTFQAEDKKEFTINSSEYNTFNHSYALTVFKSQGKTRMEVLHYGEANTNYHEAYVAGSRHQGEKDKIDELGNVEKGSVGYKLYMVEKDIEAYKEAITKEAVRYTTLDSKECIQAEKEYIDYKIFENQKGSELPEQQIAQINKNELVDSLKNEQSLKTDLEQISKIQTQLNEMTPAEQSIFQKALEVNKTINKEVELTPEQIDKQQIKPEQLDKKIAESVKGVETKEEADRIYKEVIIDNLNDKYSNEAVEKQVKAQELKPKPMPSDTQSQKVEVNPYEADIIVLNEMIDKKEKLLSEVMYSSNKVGVIADISEIRKELNTKIESMEQRFPDMYTDMKFYEVLNKKGFNDSKIVEGISNSEVKFNSEEEKLIRKNLTDENIKVVERGLSGNKINTSQPLSDAEIKERNKEAAARYVENFTKNQRMSSEMEQQRKLQEEKGLTLKKY